MAKPRHDHLALRCLDPLKEAFEVPRCCPRIQGQTVAESAESVFSRQDWDLHSRQLGRLGQDQWRSVSALLVHEMVVGLGFRITRDLLYLQGIEIAKGSFASSAFVQLQVRCPGVYLVL